MRTPRRVILGFRRLPCSCPWCLPEGSSLRGLPLHNLRRNLRLEGGPAAAAAEKWGTAAPASAAASHVREREGGGGPGVPGASGRRARALLLLCPPVDPRLPRHHPLQFGEIHHRFHYLRLRDLQRLLPAGADRRRRRRSVRPPASPRQERLLLPGDHLQAISGASVSANASTARTGNLTMLLVGDAQEPAASFQSTASFAAIPLQPAPHGSGPLNGFMSGPLERGLASGPLERGGAASMSGPLERGGAVSMLSGPLDAGDRSNFSAPLYYSSDRRPAALRRLVRGALSFSGRRWMQRLFTQRPPEAALTCAAAADAAAAGPSEKDYGSTRNLQWAHGKAGEDRVHVVLSEEQGWLFVGIYDGFSGPDAPDFLMGNLYKAIDRELEGLLWDFEDGDPGTNAPRSLEEQLSRTEKVPAEDVTGSGAANGSLEDQKMEKNGNADARFDDGEECGGDGPPSKEETDSSSKLSGHGRKSKRLYELLQMELMEEQNARASPSVSSRTADGVPHDPELALCRAQSCSEKEEHAPEQTMGKKKMKKISLVGSKMKLVYSKRKSIRKKLFPWSYDWHRDPTEDDDGDKAAPGSSSSVIRRCKAGPVDHDAVLKALSQALEATEAAFMDMVERALDRNPELALMGSCVLVMLMKDQDVYTMNLGDSRVILAQERPSAQHLNRASMRQTSLLCAWSWTGYRRNIDSPISMTWCNLQEVLRIKAEHPDDVQAVFNDRVKGQLKVTRAFGAALLEMFRINYVGTLPYVSCVPSIVHHRLCPGDRFLVLSSDGLYQYFSNEEVISHVAWFMDNVPEGDPAQYLIAELLFRAAKKNGMDFHALLDIPHGDRRKYHDDVSVMVVSLEGRIWRSSGLTSL
ncbi:unnamed protein product [Spirodela intermedia]|uniref:protein-serine/threonine phosphatase n=1 Tax=Spirodela intermedia TaxID=51605 RepID=A0A7I8J0L8_SPIIN|nr:unnamed protein product [Spirodela intermedia]CAA6663678.1 unnamed protein product [Spirodela intermedia]